MAEAMGPCTYNDLFKELSDPFSEVTAVDVSLSLDTDTSLQLWSRRSRQIAFLLIVMHGVIFMD